MQTPPPKTLVAHDKLLPPKFGSRSDIAIFAVVVAIILILISGPWGGLAKQASRENELKKSQAAEAFQHRRDEAAQAYVSGKINLAEREGLLARIRDEEEKLK